MQYQLINDSNYVLITGNDGVISVIPDDPANTDWQEYQKWLTELDENGNPNQPLPAE